MPDISTGDQLTNQTRPVPESGQLAAKWFDEVCNSVVSHPTEAAFAVGAIGLTVGAMVLSRGKIGVVSVLEAPIAKLELASESSLPVGIVRAAARGQRSTLEKAAWKVEQFFSRVSYPVPSTQAVDVASLDLSRAVPAVQHKTSVELLSRDLEKAHSLIPADPVVRGERDLIGVYRPLLSRRYGNAPDLKLLEIGSSNSVAIPRTFASKLSSYTAVDFSKPSIEQQASALSKFGQFEKQLIRADVTDIPVSSGSQDLVVANRVPAFHTDPADNMTKAYAEAARVLRKDGELVVFPFRYSDQVHPLLGDTFKVVDAQRLVKGTQSALALVFKKL